MESSSTTRRAGLPWMANLATLAVVVTATVWSGAQRPAQAPIAHVEPAAESVAPAPLPAATRDTEDDAAPLRVQAVAPTAALPLAVQRVAYTAPAR